MAFAPPKRQGGSVRVVEAERDTARGIGGGARQRAVGGSGQRGRGWGTHGTQVRRVWGLAKACAGVFVCARAGGGRCVLFWFVLLACENASSFKWGVVMCVLAFRFTAISA